jgi:hypothetical protein
MSRLASILLSVGVLVPALAACSSQQYDPNYWHQNFVGGLQKNVGKTFEKEGDTIRYSSRSGGWAPYDGLVSRTVLPNGHVAYKYRYQGTCRYTFEVDPKTDIIVAATWEGEAKHCAIVP